MPISPEVEYLRSLYRARNLALGVNVDAQAKLLRGLAEALNRIKLDEAAKAITPAMAANMRRQYEALIASFSKEFAKATASGVSVTTQRVAAIHDATIHKIGAAYGVKGMTGISFDKLNDQVMRNLAMRRGAASFTSLTAYHNKAAIGQLDSFLNQAVARGVSAGRASLDIAKILAGDDPALAEILSKLPNGMKVLRTGGLNTVDWAKYGIDPASVKDVKNLLYNARRIAVSEINNAYRESTAEAMAQSPVVAGAVWSLSGRHHIEDECDILATSDMHGLGVGVYPPELWPAGPHPHCACYAGGVRQRPVSEWLKPKGPVPMLKTSPQWHAWNYANKNASKLGWSEARLARAKKVIGNTIGLAQEAHKLKLAGVTSVAKAIKKKAVKKAAPKHTQIPMTPKNVPVAQLTEEDILFNKTAGQGGSNPGGVYIGKDGKKRYAKFYTDEAQAQGEKLANQIYSDLGLSAPQSVVMKMKDGRFLHAAEFVDMTVTVQSQGLNHVAGKKAANKILDGFAGDVLTANWDAVGLNLDNVVYLKSGGIARIDQGGAFLMRAAGRKQASLLNQITEWDNFYSPTVNKSYRSIFNAAGVDGPTGLGTRVIKQIDDIVDMRTKVGGWAKYVDDVVPGLNAVDRKAIVNMLEARTDLLISKRNAIAQALQPTPIPAVAAPKLPTPANLKLQMDAAYKELNEASDKFGNAVNKPGSKQALHALQAADAKYLDLKTKYEASLIKKTPQATLTQTPQQKIAALKEQMEVAQGEILMHPPGTKKYIDAYKKSQASQQAYYDALTMQGSAAPPVAGPLQTQAGAQKLTKVSPAQASTLESNQSLKQAIARDPSMGGMYDPTKDTFIQRMLNYTNKQKPIKSYSKAREMSTEWLQSMFGTSRIPATVEGNRAREFLGMIRDWQEGSHGSVRKSVRKYMRDGKALGEYGAAARDIAIAIDNANPAMSPTKLYRGMRIKGKNAAQVTAELLKDGVVDLGLSSFTTSTTSAKRFHQAHGATTINEITAIRFVVEGQKKALNIQALAQTSTYHAEAEWIMGGRFKVLSIQNNGAYLEVRLQQAATFEPTVGSLAVK